MAKWVVMRLLILFLLLCFCAGCQVQVCRDTCQDPLGACGGDVYVKLDPEVKSQVNEITRVLAGYGVKLKKENNLFVENAYAAEGDGQYWIWIDLTTQRILDLPDARMMMVDLVQGLMDALNKDEAIQYTFQVSNFYVSVELESFYGAYIDVLYVGRTELKDGTLNCFYAHTALDPKSVIHHMHSEPFETSVIIVNAEREANKKYKNKWSAYDSLVSPINWQTGEREYDKESQFSPFDTRGTRSNIPRTQLENGKPVEQRPWQQQSIIWRPSDLETRPLPQESSVETNYPSAPPPQN